MKDLLVCGACGSRMVPAYTTKQGHRYRYYVCLRAQKRGVSACPGQTVAAQRIEVAVAEGVLELAGKSGREALREALAVDASGWVALERTAQHGILAGVIDRVRYDGRRAEAGLRLRADLAGNPATKETTIRIRPKAWVQQPQSSQIERAPADPVAGQLPRLTRLMALAVRFEGLLREGTVRNYAELARLGGVSRARITQILNLRNLAPAIQEKILFPLPDGSWSSIPERALRRITGCPDWRRQMALFEKL